MMNAAKLRLIATSSREAGTAPTTGAVDPETCSADDARAALRHVLQSLQFEASERNRRFLEYVVEETLAGRAERIKAYSIATVVFGRDANFDPQLDPVVRMEARRLRRSLERFYLTEGRNSPIRLAMPKGGYVPEFQNALAAKTDSSSARKRASSDMSRCPGSSIFVTPFETEGDPSIFLNYNEGFTRQLLVGLSRFPELSVFGPGVVVGYNSDVKLPVSALQVDVILSGSTAVFADVINVKATLVDARTGRLIWGQTLERELNASGVLSARDEIANCIVRTLAQPFGVMFSNSFGSDGEDDARDLTAYECLRRFYQYRRSYRRDLFPGARACLERVVMADPGFAEAFACLSQVYSDGHRFGFASGELPVALKRQAAAFAQKAIDLAPDSSRGYHAQGLASWFLQDVDSSLKALQTALKLNPNATQAMVDLGLHRCLLAEWDRGIPLLEEAVARDPVQLDASRVGLSLHHFMNGRFEQALAEASRIRAPHVTYGFVVRAISLVRLGRHEEARRAVDRILNISPHYGGGMLLDLGGGNLDAHIAGEIELALADAGLAMAPARH